MASDVVQEAYLGIKPAAFSEPEGVQPKVTHSEEGV
jgi:hypothetical protein